MSTVRIPISSLPGAPDSSTPLQRRTDPWGTLVEDQLNNGAYLQTTDDDWKLILPYLEENERLFGIRIEEDLKQDLLIVEITDDGKGMEGDFARRATDPFVTTNTRRRVGLGLPLFAEAAARKA